MTSEKLKTAARGWLGLCLGLGCIAAFMFWLGPLMERNLAPVGELARFIDRTGIETNMIWYSEVSVTGEAELGARTALRFPPQGPR